MFVLDVARPVVLWPGGLAGFWVTGWALGAGWEPGRGCWDQDGVLGCWIGVGKWVGGGGRWVAGW